MEWREASSSSHSYLDTRMISVVSFTPRDGEKPSICIDDGVGCRICLQVSEKRKISRTCRQYRVQPTVGPALSLSLVSFVVNINIF